MAFNKDTFNDQATMLHVRTNVINPLVSYMKNDVDPKIAKVDDIERKATSADLAVTDLIPQVERSFVDFDSTVSNKTVRFTNNHGDGKVLDLQPMFDSIPVPPPQGITVQDITEVKELHFDGARVIESPGSKGKVSITIDPPEPTYGKVSGSDRSAITTVEVTGNKGASSVSNGVLTIELPASGGGGVDPQPPATPPNFLGFYNSLDDLKEQIKDPVINKSYAYVRYSQDGLVYEVPYWYATGGEWKVLTTKPALIYKETGSSDSVLIQSIKPTPDISVSSAGELDLSNLGSQYFHGLFDSSNEMKAEIKNPTVGKSFAYAKADGTSTMLGWQYVAGAAGGANEWKICVPFGALGLVERNGSGTATSTTVYGFNKNDMISVDTQGLITIKDVAVAGSSLKVEIGDDKGAFTEAVVETIQFKNAVSYASVVTSEKKLTIEPPQRVIQYTSSFESSHDDDDFKGSIFYDTNTQSWMGQDSPPGTDPSARKWTRIAHRNMSDEVKGTLKRVPSKITSITAGVTGDAPLWETSSWSYVEKDDPQLPEEIREKLGGYFVTMVKNVDTDPTKPTVRMQLFYSDEQVPKSYSRIWNKDAGDSGDQWYGWVKTSHHDDGRLTTHEEDFIPHKNAMKYYKIVTFNPIYKTLKANNYKIPGVNFKVLADSYGLSQPADAPDMVIPYDGEFIMNGVISPDNFERNSGVVAGKWVFIISKTTAGGDQSLIKRFEVSAASVGAKDYDPAKWYINKTPFKKGDTISFKVQHSNDATFETIYKDEHKPPRFHSLRSYIVLQDESTETGSIIAESYRELLGPLNAVDNNAVNVHSGTSDTIRVYGEKVNVSFKNMTPQ